MFGLANKYWEIKKNKPNSFVSGIIFGSMTSILFVAFLMYSLYPCLSGSIIIIVGIYLLIKFINLMTKVTSNNDYL